MVFGRAIRNTLRRSDKSEGSERLPLNQCRIKRSDIPGILLRTSHRRMMRSGVVISLNSCEQAIQNSRGNDWHEFPKE
jgi:hypothetical protein